MLQGKISELDYKTVLVDVGTSQGRCCLLLKQFIVSFVDALKGLFVRVDRLFGLVKQKGNIDDYSKRHKHSINNAFYQVKHDKLSINLVLFLHDSLDPLILPKFQKKSQRNHWKH